MRKFLPLLFLLILPACAISSAARDNIAKRHSIIDPEQTAADIRDGFPAKGNPATARKETISIGDTERSYLVQTPEGNGPFPIVILLHGETQNAETVWEQTSLPNLADAHGFILAAPQAVGNRWNDGMISARPRSKDASSADDLAFLQKLIRKLVEDEHGGADAVFMVGASNGGAMTMHYACTFANDLRAAATVMATMISTLATNCPVAKPVPWLAVNGTNDRQTLFNGQSQPPTLSADNTFNFWANAARCAPQTDSVKLPHNGNSYDVWAERRTRQNCADGATSVYYVMHGSGHTWPGAVNNTFSRMLGGASRDIDSGTIIMDFFGANLP